MKNLLIFQHVEREAPSYIAEYAEEKNIGMDIVELWKGRAIPDVRSYDGLIVLGGPMGVYEDFPWKKDEMQAIAHACTAVPVLGICLGAQLLAYALGGRVYPHTKDGKPVKEIGYSTVTLTVEGKKNSLFKDFSEKVPVLQWHGDTFDMPENASHLAVSGLCDNQAFCVRNVYGLQFHVEITPVLLQTIAREDREWANTHCTLDEEKLFADAEQLAPLMRKQCYQLLDNFLS